MDDDNPRAPCSRCGRLTCGVRKFGSASRRGDIAGETAGAAASMISDALVAPGAWALLGEEVSSSALLRG